LKERKGIGRKNDSSVATLRKLKGGIQKQNPKRRILFTNIEEIKGQAPREKGAYKATRKKKKKIRSPGAAEKKQDDQTRTRDSMIAEV